MFSQRSNPGISRIVNTCSRDSGAGGACRSVKVIRLSDSERNQAQSLIDSSGKPFSPLVELAGECRIRFRSQILSTQTGVTFWDKDGEAVEMTCGRFQKSSPSLILYVLVGIARVPLVKECVVLTPYVGHTGFSKRRTDVELPEVRNSTTQLWETGGEREAYQGPGWSRISIGLYTGRCVEGGLCLLPSLVAPERVFPESLCVPVVHSFPQVVVEKR